MNILIRNRLSIISSIDGLLNNLAHMQVFLSVVCFSLDTRLGKLTTSHLNLL